MLCMRSCELVNGEHPHLLHAELFQMPLRAPTVVIGFQFSPYAAMVLPAAGNRYRPAIELQEEIGGGLVGKC